MHCGPGKIPSARKKEFAISIVRTGRACGLVRLGRAGSLRTGERLKAIFEGLYKLRVGDYRVIFVRVGHRWRSDYDTGKRVCLSVPGVGVWFLHV